MSHAHAAHVLDVYTDRISQGIVLDASQRAEFARALETLHRITR